MPSENNVDEVFVSIGYKYRNLLADIKFDAKSAKKSYTLQTRFDQEPPLSSPSLEALKEIFRARVDANYDKISIHQYFGYTIVVYGAPSTKNSARYRSYEIYARDEIVRKRVVVCPDDVSQAYYALGRAKAWVDGLFGLTPVNSRKFRYKDATVQISYCDISKKHIVSADVLTSADLPDQYKCHVESDTLAVAKSKVLAEIDRIHASIAFACGEISAKVMYSDDGVFYLVGHGPNGGYFDGMADRSLKVLRAQFIRAALRAKVDGTIQRQTADLKKDLETAEDDTTQRRIAELEKENADLKEKLEERGFELIDLDGETDCGSFHNYYGDILTW